MYRGGCGMFDIAVSNGSYSKGILSLLQPFNTSRQRHVRLSAETGQALKKQLFRALLSQLHPGGIWNP
jgi:hypothetical protein